MCYTVHRYLTISAKERAERLCRREELFIPSFLVCKQYLLHLCQFAGHLETISLCVRPNCELLEQSRKQSRVISHQTLPLSTQISQNIQQKQR